MMTTISRLSLATFFLAPLTSFAQSDASRVSSGTKAAACDVPPVVYVRGCTGTLVHPEVVVYAAHCGKAKAIQFGESRQGKSVATKKCGTNPKFSFSPPTQQWDWAYCVLAEPVTDIPVVPIAYGCEKELFAKPGQEVLQIGFGETGSKDPGIKHWGMSQLSAVGNGKIAVGDTNSVVACPGDSGGPLMVKGDDGAWRTIGIASTYNGTCGAGGKNTYADIQDAVPWLEQESGYDLTPCFDSSGKWEPGPDCGGFYAGNPGEPKGSWADMCEGTPVSGKSTTCGENGSEDEEDGSEEGEASGSEESSEKSSDNSEASGSEESSEKSSANSEASGSEKSSANSEASGSEESSEKSSANSEASGSEKSSEKSSPSKSESADSDAQSEDSSKASESDEASSSESPEDSSSNSGGSLDCSVSHSGSGPAGLAVLGLLALGFSRRRS